MRRDRNGQSVQGVRDDEGFAFVRRLWAPHGILDWPVGVPACRLQPRLMRRLMAMKVDPKSQHLINASQGWMELGDYDAAELELTLLPEKDSDSAPVIELRSEICARTERWAECEDGALRGPLSDKGERPHGAPQPRRRNEYTRAPQKSARVAPSASPPSVVQTTSAPLVAPLGGADGLCTTRRLPR